MSQTPRVWHLLSNRWNSAITEYALSAAKALNNAGIDNLFSPLKDSPGESRSVGMGLKTEPLASFGLSSLRVSRKIFRDFLPDAVITYGGPESFLLHFFPETTRIRFRGHELTPSTVSNIQQRISHRHIDKIVVPGSPLFESCSSIFGREKVETIMLGCDTSIYRYTGPVEKKIRPELLIFGRFDPVKGHIEFLRMFRKILDRWPEQSKVPILTFAGEPANVSAESLQQAAKDLGIGPDHLNIKTGRFENVAAMMSAATLGVVSSLGSEQICRVAEEFLLCGTPVAVSGAGSLNDVLFANAGVSYKGFNLDDAAALLMKSMQKFFEESENVRIERSRKAAQLFSYEAMGRALAKLL